MSNVAALIKFRQPELSDGLYLERADERVSRPEKFLRKAYARMPRKRAPGARAWALVRAVNALEAQMQAATDEDLRAALQQAGSAMRQAGFSDALLAQAFAAVREASRRINGMRHHDVQLIGGWALLQGRIAEMETGEGKTLVATLAACVAAAAGSAVHVITVNDYLAARDAELNGALFAFFGFSVGVIKEGMEAQERRAIYLQDLVYVSNKEIVFDYLKDRIAADDALASQQKIRSLYRGRQTGRLLLRGLHLAIVDEADSILIDEARTPLIISETVPDENGPDLYKQALALAEKLQREIHFDISIHREVWLTRAGEAYLRELCQPLSGVFSSPLWRRELIEKALSALWCFERDQHYIVFDDKVHIVDEFSGRVMSDRSWERGLHQMIEAKENVSITGARRTLARLTYQRFMRRYLFLCGMTGTAAEVAPELRHVYELDILKIPTNLPSKRLREPDLCLLTPQARWERVVQRARAVADSGRAVLIGTRSVEASEHLSALFAAAGVSHKVLNARQDKEEADTVAQAGQPGQITIATNMAGRGTDIKLAPEVAEKGGLFVILTEFHESARVDRQLFGRCARQGNPGSVQAIVCLQDDLFSRFAPLLRELAIKSANSAGEVPPWMLRRIVAYAQNNAERYNLKIRSQTMAHDEKLQDMLGFAGRPT
ncbi:prepilin peptidase [Massilia sp. W12]|uniref:preprotein translocase subunit SecA n=1 Tax=Massilia sp. W12 TaxID=3126507 RepID=UPI0030D49BBC